MIRAQDLSKTYRLYDKPHHRLLQSFWGDRRQYYRDFAAIQNVSFELDRGQTLGIIGRNGAGKSTLLQIICGTLTPSAGNVEVRGRIAALLELGTGFNPDFTGRENLFINAAILGLTPLEIEARTEDIIAFADIGRFIDQPVKTYSSGMYVRLAFAVVVHVEPDILIVDEALAVGDAFFQAKCMTRMRRMLDDGLTLLFISHDISAVKALCSRTLWLEQGQVRALGATPDITRAYDQDWIRQANAAQGIDEHLPASKQTPAQSQVPNALTVPEQAGTGGVRLLAVAWGTQGLLASQTRATYGQTLTLHLRLQIVQPCAQLVVSYHIKNRQNQHLLGGHTADRPEVYGRTWAPDDTVDLTFDIPVHLHQGDYALTLVASSIADTERYTDALFHLWADDVATLQVQPRAHFPLSDLIEPPPSLTIQASRQWVILDDFFPNLLTGFRVAEYNAHLHAFPQMRVLSSLPDFSAQHASYAALYPDLANRVQHYSPDWLQGCELAYINFLNNAVLYLPALEQHGIPFVLTLYPGGGLGLNEPESDAKLAQVLASKLLQAIIVTQAVTESYLRSFAQQQQLHLPPLHRIDGLVVNPLYFTAQALVPAAANTHSTTELHICFVAERYMPLGANKGYPEFIAAALSLADLQHLRFHVVGGGFTPQELDVSALGERIQFHGRLETDQLRRFYDGMNLIVSPNQPGLLHPGNFDGFPTGCCVEAALCGVAVMATDALQQNPGYVDGESIFLLDAAASPLAQQVESRLRHLASQPQTLKNVGQSGQALTRQRYAPERQIGERQRILSEVAAQLVPQPHDKTT
jgi:lipopolysaccharide transport system ATP-binding protein